MSLGLEAACAPVELFVLAQDPLDFFKLLGISCMDHRLNRKGGGPNRARATRAIRLGLALSLSEPQCGHRCGIKDSHVRQSIQSSGRAEAYRGSR